MTESDLKYWKAVLGPIVPEHLVTPEVVALRDQQNKMLNLMAKKNADYGNAFNTFTLLEIPIAVNVPVPNEPTNVLVSLTYTTFA